MTETFKIKCFKILTVLIDGLLVAIALYSSYLIRFDFDIWPLYRVQLIKLLPLFVLIRITALFYFGGYRGIWKYTSLNDLISVMKGILFGAGFLAGVNYFRNYPLGLLIAMGFFTSAVFFQGIFHFTSIDYSKRKIFIGILLVSVLILGMGVFAFTIFLSAPVSISELPLGEYIVSLDFQNSLSMPRSILILEPILSFLLVSGIRVFPRLIIGIRIRWNRKGRRVLVFGAGDVGENIVRAMMHHPEFNLHPIGFIDDHPAKQGISIHGIEVLGTRNDLLEVLEKSCVEELLIGVSSLSREDLKEIGAICWKRKVPIRKVPGSSALLNGRMGLEYLEEVDVEDLLGRLEVELDPTRVIAYLREKVILVTGAGGSIGSELCRQISKCEPHQLILFGKGENSIYHIQKELVSLFPKQTIVSVIGDIRNREKIDRVFRIFRPEVVFHSAAHKHVPFMEENPEEAVLNNVFGTENVAKAAIRYEASKFVFISTDKAVNPRSIMGATKKLAEVLLQRLSRGGSTQLITVRFGNVLRSSGSVVPLFEKQIRNGGPVTVTHPEMKRYFMSIPEAVRLVLHSGAIGDSGDLCVLEMGDPVRILDLAENMIILAGLKPYEDIDIVFNGIRPGEKLLEELLTLQEAETVRKIDKILICKPRENDWNEFELYLKRLKIAAGKCHSEDTIRLIKEVVLNHQSVEK